MRLPIAPPKSELVRGKVMQGWLGWVGRPLEWPRGCWHEGMSAQKDRTTDKSKPREVKGSEWKGREEAKKEKAGQGRKAQRKRKHRTIGHAHKHNSHAYVAHVHQTNADPSHAQDKKQTNDSIKPVKDITE